jgi:hypothetical protein
MPCNTVSVVSTDLGKMDASLLVQGLRNAGFEVSDLKDTGRIFLDGASVREVSAYGSMWIEGGELKATSADGEKLKGLVSQIKRAYSAEVVKQTARRFGWQVKQVGVNKYQVIKG